jgi:hypothetical protein
MLDRAVGPNVIRKLLDGYRVFLEQHAGRGWRSLEDFRGLMREKVVAHAKIRRPDSRDYRGGYEPQEGYAEPDSAPAAPSKLGDPS